MIVIPAIDLRDGACVQLVGGSYAEERVRLADPVAVARDWADLGFTRLHVVDLDAATGAGNNDSIVEAIVRQSELSVQVGGGIRDDTRARALLDMGAASVVVGTRAVEDPEWLTALATANPDRVIVAADVRERRVVTHGWARAHAREIIEFIGDIAGLPLAGILVTAVHREGLMSGPDLALMEAVTRAASVPVIASGGIASMTDLESLGNRRVASAVIGMALYTGALDARQVVQEFGR
ncbi:MAG: 1-(5-phosphoribosyl)-5-[(5-phosphoribosylamino)methylideneamino] imidazole-4-carboxamide isomerase [Gemmatimonadaceae bacterium]